MLLSIRLILGEDSDAADDAKMMQMQVLIKIVVV